ncbi:MAG: hypothetical protein NC548_40995, partial [Lachnospiraceae bacterium]|nr:hypothetical protein [Lachnospiraceae bacterium]
KQDISSKVMLYHNDVFSDIINALLFEKNYIDESRLKDVIPESAYEDFDGNLRSMERDLLKEYGEGDGTNYFAIAEFGIGNQTTVDLTMPVRVMGYDYTVYKRQLDEYTSKKRDLYRLLRKAHEIGNAELIRRVQADIDRLGDFKLVPVITIILNFSRTKWNKSKTLKGLVPDGHPEVTAFMQDYQVKIFDVLYLDEASRSRFTSDFRDVVTVLAEGAIDKNHDFQRLKYPVDALDMLYAYTKDEHYLNIRNQIIKKEQEGEVIRMGDFFDQVERNKIIETARKMYQKNSNTENAVCVIECGLDISTAEAQEIFETEVLGIAIA